MDYEEFARRVQILVSEALRSRTGNNRADKARLLNKIQELADAARLDEGALSDLIADVARQFDWIADRVLSTYEQAATAEIIETTGNQFALTTRGILKDVASVVLPLLSSDATTRELEGAIENVIGRRRRYNRTIANTAIGALQTAKRVSDALSAGTNYFQYIGPPAERSFCRGLLGNIYTLQEIEEELDNGQRLPCLHYRGGWNCRHQWVAIFDVAYIRQTREAMGRPLPFEGDELPEVGPYRKTFTPSKRSPSFVAKAIKRIL